MIAVDSIFFDVDGTLVDAREDIVNAVNHALKKLALPPRPKEEIVSYIGTGVKDLVGRSLGPSKSALTDEGVKIFSQYYVRHATDETKIYPHVEEALSYFSDKRKFILTNRYIEFADITLRALGIRKYFENIFGGDDETCLKPSACVLDRILPKLKIEKVRSIIVGDMAIDIMTGKNSGIKTCWVTYGLGRPEDVKKLDPDYIIDDLIELKNIIR